MEQRIITSTELRTWKSCRLKWWFRYDQCLVPRRKQEALTFGSLIHAGAEAYYLKQDWRKAIGEFIREQETPWGDEESRFVVSKAVALLEGYIKRDPVRREGHTVESVEREFSVPLRSPAGRRETRYLLAGKRDLATRDPSGNLWLWDHKTGSMQLDTSHLEIDDQMETYIWADTQDGLPACGIFYNLIRKPSIKPRQKETPSQWYHRLSEDIESRPEFYYQTEMIVKTQRHLDRIETDLWEIAHKIGKGHIYRNPASCTIFGCSYRELCQNDSLAIRSSMYDHERRHIELEEVV